MGYKGPSWVHGALRCNESHDAHKHQQHHIKQDQERQPSFARRVNRVFGTHSPSSARIGINFPIRDALISSPRGSICWARSKACRGGRALCSTGSPRIEVKSAHRAEKRRALPATSLDCVRSLSLQLALLPHWTARSGAMHRTSRAGAQHPRLHHAGALHTHMHRARTMR